MYNEDEFWTALLSDAPEPQPTTSSAYYSPELFPPALSTTPTPSYTSSSSPSSFFTYEDPYPLYPQSTSPFFLDAAEMSDDSSWRLPSSPWLNSSSSNSPTPSLSAAGHNQSPSVSTPPRPVACRRPIKVEQASPSPIPPSSALPQHYATSVPAGLTTYSIGQSPSPTFQPTRPLVKQESLPTLVISNVPAPSSSSSSSSSTTITTPSRPPIGKTRKTFHCETAGCKATFTKKSSFDKHLRVHTGERPFGCHYCIRARFSNRSNLTRHFKSCPVRKAMEPQLQE